MNAYLSYIYSQLVCTISRIFNWKKANREEKGAINKCWYVLYLVFLIGNKQNKKKQPKQKNAFTATCPA